MRRFYPIALILAYVLLIVQTFVLVTALNRQTDDVKSALCDALRVSIESDVETTAYIQAQTKFDDEQGRRIIRRLEASFNDICEVT